MKIENIYWIGGSSCSGKSSIATQLAEKYGIKLYKTDENAFGKYMFGLEDIESYPDIKRYKDLLMEGMDGFMEYPLSDLLDAFTHYCREVFPFILKDISEISDKEKLIVEGAHLFPEIINEFVFLEQCIFLLSSKEQQRSIWKKEMTGEIEGGHPGEIQNYVQSANKEKIEDFRIHFHDSIREYIHASALTGKMKCILVEPGFTQETVKAEVETHLNVRS